MKFLRVTASLLCCFLLFFPLCVHAAETDSNATVQQMLNYYYHYQSAARTDIYRLLEELESTDPETAALWRSIFDYWIYAAEDSPKNVTTLSDDLPQDDTLCIVVLGYSLNASGSMKPELIERLTLALAAAEQYPNAHIICTGGGTAPDNPNVTEADQMAQWLRKNGIDTGRIRVENRSTHTIQNARYVLQILSHDYPQIAQMVLVTSDYHITRSSTLFHAAAELTAQHNGTAPISIAACLGYDAPHEGYAEDILDQTAHVARLCGFEFVRDDNPPALSELTGISVSCPAELEIGQALPLTVTAQYSSDYSRDITAYCQISPYDPMATESQHLQIRYQENGKLLIETVKILRPAPETEPAAEVPAEPTPGQTHAAQEPAPASLSPYLLFLAPVILLIPIFRKKNT